MALDEDSVRQMEGGRGSRRWSGSRNLLTLVLLVMLVAPVLCDYAPENITMGVNYGRVGDNLPSPTEAVSLISKLGITRVRLFDPDAATLLALESSELEVTIGMGNDAISPLTDAATADQWVQTHVAPYSRITTILVGNELFTDTSRSAIWPLLVPAIRNLHASLQRSNRAHVKLSTAAELNTLGWSYPPSKGVFRTDIAAPVLTSLLQFLNDTGSHLFINVYPYFGWRDDQSYIPMDYALFTRKTPFIVDGDKKYYNLLDAQLDAVFAAMERLGFPDVRLAISETGWPTAGAGGNVANARIYNSNLISYVLSRRGTPRRPGLFIPTFVFALFNENLKPGGAAEQNWGVLYPDGSEVYPLQWRNGSSPSSPVVAAAPAPSVVAALAPFGVAPSTAVAPSGDVPPSAGLLESGASGRADLVSVLTVIFVGFLSFLCASDSF